MARNPCVDRLQKEYKKLLKDPSPNIKAHPLPSNLLEWHYALEGPKESDYEGGIYHGKITFPKQYPFKPPSICMLTPSGRFVPNTNLCLSMTDFHPESWNPMWSVGTILTGLLSFMLESAATTGAVNASPEERHSMAQQSWQFNAKNPTFRKLFPEYLQEASPSSAPQQNTNKARQRQKPDAAGQVKPEASQDQGLSSSAAAAGPETGQSAAHGSQAAENVGGADGGEGSAEAQPSAKELIDQTIEQAMRQMRIKSRGQSSS